MVSPSLAETKHLSSPLSDPKPDPRGFEGTEVDIKAIPLEFHKENTVTEEIIFDGFEDEDYIDFDRILAEGSDDYLWVLTVLLLAEDLKQTLLNEIFSIACSQLKHAVNRCNNAE